MHAVTAGVIGSIITMPFDVIKTKMQGLEAQRYSGTLDCIAKVVRNEGLIALYKGLGARLGRAVVSDRAFVPCHMTTEWTTALTYLAARFAVLLQPGQGIIFASYEYFSLHITRGLHWAVAGGATPRGLM